MRKSGFWLTVVFVLAMIAPLAAPAGATGVRQSMADVPKAVGPDVSDVRVGSPTVFETFRSDDGTWNTGSGAQEERTIADGMLIIDVAEKNTLSWVTYDKRPSQFEDFYLEVDAELLSGPTANNFGVAFRMQDSDNFYLFDIDCEGQYEFSKLVDNQWETIIDWTPSQALNTGRNCANTLGLLAVGDWIVLLANDTELRRVRDNTFAQGQVALAAGTYDRAGTEAGFDNFRLWTAKTSSSELPVNQAGNATVTSDTLNVRSGPSTAHPVVGTLRRGDRVQMVGRSDNGQWVKIDLSGKPQAWIAARYIKPDVGIQSLPVAKAPAPPAGGSRSSCNNEAYLLLENHIGKYITVQVADLNFRVEGKVGDVPGRYKVTLKGTGHYPVAAQLPNVGSVNFDLYVEATPSACGNRTDCLALCETLTIPFSLER